MVEEEDVLIDDISAIVIELKTQQDIMRSVTAPTSHTSGNYSDRNRSMSEVDPNPVQIAGNRYTKRQSIFKNEEEKAPTPNAT